MLSRSSTGNGKSTTNTDSRINSKTAFFNYGSFSNDIGTDDDLICLNKHYFHLIVLFNRCGDGLLSKFFVEYTVILGCLKMVRGQRKVVKPPQAASNQNSLSWWDLLSWSNFPLDRIKNGISDPADSGVFNKVAQVHWLIEIAICFFIIKVRACRFLKLYFKDFKNHCRHRN